MANLKFYKMATAPVGTTEKPLLAGAIWFNTTNHSIEVYDGAKWTVFSGVLDASVVNEKLTIVKHDGSKVEVDFSIYATDEALEILAGRVSTLEGTVATHGSDIENLKGRMNSAEGKLAGLSENTVMAEIAKQVKVETDRATGVEGGLDTRLGTLETKVNDDHEGRIVVLEGYFGEGDGTVADQIADAVAAAEGRVDEKLATKADKATYEAYVAANDERVAKAEKAIEDEVARAEAEEALINEKIGVPVEVEGVDAYSKDYTVGMDVKAAKDAAKAAHDAADAAQATIDKFLTDEGIDTEAVDTLKEIIAYMESHGSEYQDVVANLNELNEGVADLQAALEGEVAQREAEMATLKGEMTSYTDEAIASEVERSESAYEKIGVAKNLVDALAEGAVKANADEIARVDAAWQTSMASEKATRSAEDARLAGLIAAEAETRAGELDSLKKEAYQAADAAEADANAYTDGKVQELNSKIDTGLTWVVFE